MSEYKKRSELIRKVEKKMKKRNRKVSTFLFIFGLLLGLAVGAWLMVSGIIPQSILGQPNPVPPEEIVTPLPDEPTEVPVTDDPTDEIQPAPEDQVPDAELDDKAGDADPADEWGLDEDTSQQGDNPEDANDEDVVAAANMQPRDLNLNAPTEEPVVGQQSHDTEPEQPVTEPDAPVTEPEAPPDEELAAADTPAEPEITPEPVITSEPIPVFKSLKLDDWNDDVKAMQEKLVELGLLTGKADGIFGPKTVEAVKAYQSSQGLEATGVADDETQKRLFGYAEPEPEPEPVELATVERTPEPIENIAMVMGETYNCKDEFTFSIDRYEFKQVVEGSNIAAAGEDIIPISFQTTNSDHTFLCLIGTITNTGEADFMPNALRYAIATGSEEEYSGITAIETDDGKNLMGYGTLEAGQMTTLVLLVEVPIALETNAESIVATITVGNTIYTLPLR